MLLKLGTAVLLLAALANANNATDGPKVLCYYDGSSARREGLGKVTIADIEPALPFCTHLVFGFAVINPANSYVRGMSEDTAIPYDGSSLYREVTNLKDRYPDLKVLLSVGGHKDLAEEKPLEMPTLGQKAFEKYLTVLEGERSRTAFVESVYSLLRLYDFDGLDLAWQFPPTKPKRIRGTVGNLWHGFKKLFTGDSVLDPMADRHRGEFTALVRDLKKAFEHDKYILGLTVLPHVNDTMFLEIPLLKNNLDYVHLAAFDQQTPERNPKEGDFTAPIYEPTDRVVGNNIDAEAKHWLAGGIPAAKIIIGIPAYGRGWELTEESGNSGVPPIPANGPASPGPYTNIPGFFSWPEVCSKLPNPGNANLRGADYPLRMVGDPSKRYGVYAFRAPEDKGKHGIWLSYEDPESAGNKAAYVKAKGLGGISIFDLGTDDVRGVCAGDKFPILRAAKYRL